MDAETSPSTARESLLVARNALFGYRDSNRAFDKSHEASLEGIAAKFNQLVSALGVHEGSTYGPLTNGASGSREWCLMCENIQAELDEARTSYKEHVLRSRDSEATWEGSFRAHEAKLNDDCASGEKSQLMHLNLRMDVETLSALSYEGAVAFVASSELSCYPYLIHSPLTLLELAYQMMNPNPDALEEISLLQELKMTKAELAHDMAFRRIIPIAFGTGEEWNKLSAVPTPKDFHDVGTSGTSFSRRLRSELRVTCTAVKDMIRSSDLSVNVKGLLKEMVDLSLDFSDSMLKFMWDFYALCVSTTGLSEDDSWMLVQHLTWEVLQQLSKCRTDAFAINFGPACRTPETTGRVMRSTLEMHKVMATYARQYPWENHPSLGPTITLFLLPRVAMRNEVAMLSQELEALRETLAALKPSPHVDREEDYDEEDDNDEHEEDGGDDDDDEVEHEEFPGDESIGEDSCSVATNPIREPSRPRRRRNRRRGGRGRNNG